MKLRTIGLLMVVVATSAATTLLIHSGGPRAVADTTGAAAGPVYAQLSSAMSQLPKDTTPFLVSMESNDALSGLEHNAKEKSENVVVKTPGVYFVVAAAQVGKENGEGDEYVDIWIKQNGKDVDNSGCRQAIRDPKFTGVMVCQGIAECKAGDVFNVAIAASSPGKGLGITAIKPKGEPVIPSIIFSMYRIQ